MANNTSPHILNTAANLLGFCLFIITAFKVSNQEEMSRIDELTSAIAVLLAMSCIFSFFSIRTQNPKLEKKLENMADYLFILSLIGIVVVIALVARVYF